MTIEELEKEIAELSPSEQVELAERIMIAAPIDEQVEQAWYAEAERRAIAAAAGKGESFDGPSLIAETEARLNAKL